MLNDKTPKDQEEENKDKYEEENSTLYHRPT